jgi:hypothetical protein
MIIQILSQTKEGIDAVSKLTDKSAEFGSGVFIAVLAALIFLGWQVFQEVVVRRPERVHQREMDNRDAESKKLLAEAVSGMSSVSSKTLAEVTATKENTRLMIELAGPQVKALTKVNEQIDEIDIGAEIGAMEQVLKSKESSSS